MHSLRVKRGFSCARVGEITNAARQTVSHWEAGRHRTTRERCSGRPDRQMSRGRSPSEWSASAS
ncbi:hypothetical protein ACRYCC_38110 [Actinomadura scrupuli]|uniref:hypothetical protein n=1 Tax=Actinomadura scrupuli TaxID=559629 RepID=UPI003D99C730